MGINWSNMHFDRTAQIADQTRQINGLNGDVSGLKSDVSGKNGTVTSNNTLTKTNTDYTAGQNTLYDKTLDPDERQKIGTRETRETTLGEKPDVTKGIIGSGLKKTFSDRLAALGLTEDLYYLHEAEISRLNTSIPTLSIDNTKKLNELYKATQSQNNQIRNSEHKLVDEFSADNQRVVYQLDQTEFFSGLNTIFLIVYFILVVIFIYALYAIQLNMNIYVKIVFGLVAVLYPFVILTIELMIYYFSQYIYSKF